MSETELLHKILAEQAGLIKEVRDLRGDVRELQKEVQELKDNQPKPLMTVADVKEEFGYCDDSTIYRWEKNGTLPKPIKMGKFKYYERESVYANIGLHSQQERLGVAHKKRLGA